jgi:hypothetical protein
VLKIVVVAGDYRQAIGWLDRNALSPVDPQVKIITQDNALRQLRGIRITEDDRVVVIGTAWRRRDFHDVWEELQARGWNGEYETTEW